MDTYDISGLLSYAWYACISASERASLRGTYMVGATVQSK